MVVVINKLSRKLYARITSLTEKGEKFFDEQDYDRALECFLSAYDLLPLPKESWDEGLRLLAGIGDSLFMQWNIQEAYGYFREAQKYPGGIGSPFIFLRLGQCLYEMRGRKEAILDALMSAYMLAGDEIFLDEDPKYLKFLKKYVKL
jgi:tetratricopeptide (TPR) repeat protein